MKKYKQNLEDDDLIFDEFHPSEIEIDEESILGEEDVDEIEDILEEIEPKKTAKNVFYVIPKKFDEELIRYYETNILTNELAEMVSNIANKLSYSPNFLNYSFKDMMVGDAIVKMMKAVIGKKYQHIKGTNPFSYFTRIAWNAFVNRIKIEQRQREIHEKYKEDLLTFSENYNTIVKNKNIKIQSQ